MALLARTSQLAFIQALERRDKARVWLVELQLTTGTWRASQAARDVTDDAGRTWQGFGGLGDVQGMGSGLSRRPREVRLTLFGIQKNQNLSR